MSETNQATTRDRYGLHLGLFLATCLTTTWAGARYTHGPELPAAQLWALLADGLPFAASLMGILLVHEMGHYLVARLHRVDASLPFFLPVPFLGIGTFGAVIQMREIVRRPNALVDIGAAGPLAGLALAVPLLLYGLSISEVTATGPGMLEGNSALYLVLKYLVKGQWLPGGGVDVRLHSVAWAGWVGLLVTMINLLPVGQLDGGHIAYAYFGKGQNRASHWLHRALLPVGLGASAYTAWELKRKLDLATALTLGLPAGMPWLVWFGLLFLMRRMSGGVYHPPVEDEPLSPGRRRLCLLMLVVFLLIFIPIPLRPTV